MAPLHLSPARKLRLYEPPICNETLAVALKPSAAHLRQLGTIPSDWIQVGTWKVPEEVVVADRTVTFYATRPAEATLLARALQAFQARLPPAVSARIADTGAK